MNVSIQRVSRRPDWPRTAVLVTVAWLSLVAAVTCWDRLTGHDFTLCPLRQLTGIPLAGCGTTRAVLAMLRGDPAGALRHNPLATVVIGLLVLNTALRIAAGRKLRIQLTPTQRAVALAGGVALLLANWLYVLPGSRAG